MRRRIYIWVVAAITALAVTACGDGSDIEINGSIPGQENETSGTDESGLSGGVVSDTVPEGAGGTKIEIFTGETQPAGTNPADTAAETTAAPTVAPTTAAPTTAAPTTAAPTTAAREYAVQDLDKTMYAKSAVRVRASYSTSSEILGALNEGESVAVTGESENGWMRVTWKGQTGFVAKSYLSDDPPATTAPTETRPASTTPGNTTTPGSTTNPDATTPGGTTPNSTSPTPGGTTPGSTPTTPGGTAPGGTSTAPDGTAPGTASGNGSGTMTGVITAMDPSGLTIQTADGSTYTFSWGSAAKPDLQPGYSVQITYQGSTLTQITR